MTLWGLQTGVCGRGIKVILRDAPWLLHPQIQNGAPFVCKHSNVDQDHLFAFFFLLNDQSIWCIWWRGLGRLEVNLSWAGWCLFNCCVCGVCPMRPSLSKGLAKGHVPVSALTRPNGYHVYREREWWCGDAALFHCKEGEVWSITATFHTFTSGLFNLLLAQIGEWGWLALNSMKWFKFSRMEICRDALMIQLKPPFFTREWIGQIF